MLITLFGTGKTEKFWSISISSSSVSIPMCIWRVSRWLSSGSLPAMLYSFTHSITQCSAYSQGQKGKIKNWKNS